MKITLLRHGKPDIEIPKRLNSSQIAGFIGLYDQAGIEAESIPSSDAIKLAETSNIILCSDLPRSIESAAKLTSKTIFKQDKLFCEAALPSSNWKYPTLPSMAWFYVYRILWLLGYSNNGETFKKASHRAKTASDQLTQLAKQHDKVLLVGHGVMNQLIARELLSQGWVGPKKSPREHWEYVHYEMLD